MFCSIQTCSLLAMQGSLVRVETTLANGMPYFSVVGLPDSIVRESKERIRSAFDSCGFALPLKRITVNLAPASMKKDCTPFDFPVAISILASQGLLPSHPDSRLAQSLLVGELSLNGELRPIPGTLCMARCARENQIPFLLVPKENAREAAMIEGIRVIGLSSLPEAIAWLKGELELPEEPHCIPQPEPSDLRPLGLLMGQPLALRALCISAAGFHPILLWGPPGTGKTTSARALASLLPLPSPEEYLEIASIYNSVSRTLPGGRPFRDPHHTITPSALMGGGLPPQPGEITLAHGGVLFLDELPEFKGPVLETFRQPLEDHEVRISRLGQTAVFPARFLLAASMNPCPCGFYPQERCTCSPYQIRQYLRKIRGPLLDRIDLGIKLLSPKLEDLREMPLQQIHDLRRQVEEAHKKQRARYEHAGFRFNSELPASLIQRYCSLDHEGERLIQKAYDRLNLSVRGYHRTLKVARTIADLEGSERIQTDHLLEAISLRSLEELENLQ